MKLLTITLLLSSCLIAPSAEQAKPVRHLLGLYLSMTRPEARARLENIGKFVREEGEDQEVWAVRDASFSHLVFGVGEKEKLRYLTAVARTDTEAKAMAYSDVGNLKEGREIGDAKIKNFQYRWELPAENGQPRAELLAMGRDPKFLTTVTLKNLEVGREDKD